MKILGNLSSPSDKGDADTAIAEANEEVFSGASLDGDEELAEGATHYAAGAPTLRSGWVFALFLDAACFLHDSWDEASQTNIKVAVFFGGRNFLSACIYIAGSHDIHT